MEWRDLPKQQILPYAGYFCYLSGFLHSADAAVGMTYLGGGFVYPHRLYLQRGGRQIAAPTDTPGGIPFNRTGYSRNVAWRWIIAATLRGTIHPHRLYAERGGRQICRPYRRGTSAPVVPTMLNAVPRLIHRLRRSPFPEGEGLA